ncbi:MAG TPA: UPF0280 family protein, partial [Alphaproteobacteria bacterium]|nr:UPF0280 family protein [Alphaproteobacteria bacterium]
IANAVNIDDPAIERRPAREARDESDLGDLPVTVSVGTLAAAKVAAALENGVHRATELLQRGLIAAAYLQLQGECRVVGEMKRIAAERAA